MSRLDIGDLFYYEDYNRSLWYIYHIDEDDFVYTKEIRRGLLHKNNMNILLDLILDPNIKAVLIKGNS